MNNNSIMIAVVSFAFGAVTLLAVNHTATLSASQTEKALHSCFAPLSTFCRNLTPFEED